MRKTHAREGHVKTEKAPKSLKSAMGAKMDMPGKTSPTVGSGPKGRKRKGAR